MFHCYRVVLSAVTVVHVVLCCVYFWLWIVDLDWNT